MTSLADLVGDVGAFERDHWGRRPLLRSTASSFDDLLDVDAIDRLLTTAARRPTFRLVRDGTTLPPERSTTPLSMGGRTLDDVVDVAKVAHEVANGATLVLQALQRTWPPLVDLCRALERELSHPVQANAYLTPAGAQGLAEHADEHDVLALQVTGTKAWEVEGLGAVRLRPGDVLYLPTGTRHSAASQEGRSLHLTLGIHRVTYAQAVQRTLRATETTGLDDPLPIGFARTERAGDLADGLRERLAATARALQNADADAVAEREQRRARSWRTPLGRGRLASALAVDEIDLSAAVVAPADHDAHLDPEPAPDGRIILRLRDRAVALPAEARPALDRLLTGEPAKVGELPGLSDASRVVVARRLVREGWLVIVHP